MTFFRLGPAVAEQGARPGPSSAVDLRRAAVASPRAQRAEPAEQRRAREREGADKVARGGPRGDGGAGPRSADGSRYCGGPSRAARSTESAAETAVGGQVGRFPRRALRIHRRGVVS